jgi:hypothetical protein
MRRPSAQRARRHSGLMPANLITLAQLSVSFATSLPKSAGEPPTTVPPRSASSGLLKLPLARWICPWGGSASLPRRVSPWRPPEKPQDRRPATTFSPCRRTGIESAKARCRRALSTGASGLHRRACAASLRGGRWVRAKPVPFPTRVDRTRKRYPYFWEKVGFSVSHSAAAEPAQLTDLTRLLWAYVHPCGRVLVRKRDSNPRPIITKRGNCNRRVTAEAAAHSIFVCSGS